MNAKIIGVIGGVIGIAIVVFFVFNGISTEIEQRKALEDVQISFYALDLNDIGFSGISLHFVLDMYNPNDITATLDSADFDVWINEEYVGSGFIPNRVDIPSYTTKKASADFDASFSGSLKSGISAFLEKQIRLKISGVAHYDTLLGTLEIPFTLKENYGDSKSSFESSNNFESNTDSYSEPIDSDGDGFPDSIDKCPYEYVGGNGGCPIPKIDSDGDGYLDAVDKCPYDAGLGKNYGCPMNISSKISTQILVSIEPSRPIKIGEEFCVYAVLVDENTVVIPSVTSTITWNLYNDGLLYFENGFDVVTDNSGYIMNVCEIMPNEPSWDTIVMQFEFTGNNNYLPTKSNSYTLGRY